MGEKGEGVEADGWSHGAEEEGKGSGIRGEVIPRSQKEAEESETGSGERDPRWDLAVAAPVKGSAGRPAE